MSNIVLSCEHAVRTVPREYARLFEGAEDLLQSHRGWDPGAHELSRRLRSALQAPLVQGEVTRLLIDLNRSLHNPELWSEFSAHLRDSEHQELIQRYYHPFRHLVLMHIESALLRHPRVTHISLHSFTPVLNGRERDVDVGLLYDPERLLERETCDRIEEHLREQAPDLRIRHNQPYKGTDDGLTTTLRSRLPQAQYLGIEIEVNQAFPLDGGPAWDALQSHIAGAVHDMCLAR